MPKVSLDYHWRPVRVMVVMSWIEICVQSYNLFPIRENNHRQIWSLFDKKHTVPMFETNKNSPATVLVYRCRTDENEEIAWVCLPFTIPIAFSRWALMAFLREGSNTQH